MKQLWHRFHSWELWFYRTVADAWWTWSALCVQGGATRDLSHRAIAATVCSNAYRSYRLNKIAHQQQWFYLTDNEILDRCMEAAKLATIYQRYLDRQQPQPN